jgi:hypothetical protein
MLPRLKVLGLFFGIALLYFWKILIVHQYSLITGFEGANQAYSWYTFLARSLQSHASILWDPFSFSGHPFLEEMQNGALYPVNLLVALFPLKEGVFSPGLYHWLYALTHVAGAFFMFLLARELGLSVFAGILSGLGFAFGGVMVRSGGWPHLFQSFIWFPLIFLWVRRAMNSTAVSTTVFYAALGGAGIALSVLAGGLYPAIMQGILVLSMGAFIAFQSSSKQIGAESRQAIWRRCVTVVLVVVLVAAAGSAAQLVPSLEGSGSNLRTVGPVMVPENQKTPYNYIDKGVWLHSFVTMFLAPTAFGGDVGPGEHVIPYMGVLGFALAAIGVWKRWSSMWVRFCAWTIAGTLAYAMAEFSILHGVMYSLVPRLWMAREASRALYLADFALAILIAYGADYLFRPERDEWGKLWVVLKWTAIGCGAVLASGAIYPHADISPWLDLSLVLMLVISALLWKATHGQRDWTMHFLVVFVLLFDLYAFDWSATNVMEARSQNADQLDRLYSFRGVAEFLKSKSPPFRVEMQTQPISNVGDTFGVETTWGAAATVVGIYDHYHGKTDLWNARYLVRPVSAQEPGAIYADKAWKVYENSGATPRAWLVHNALVEPDEARAEIRLRDAAFRLTETAVIPTPLSKELTPGDVSERVDYLNYESDRFVLKVHAKGAALLTLSEVYYPGWLAFVNGKATPIIRADGALRAVEVDAGDNVVEFRFRPRFAEAGIILSSLTFLGLGGAAFGMRRRTAWDSRRTGEREV